MSRHEELRVVFWPAEHMVYKAFFFGKLQAELKNTMSQFPLDFLFGREGKAANIRKSVMCFGR